MMNLDPNEVEVRPFSTREDCEAMINYFLTANDAFLRGMGVDPAKLPKKEDWLPLVLLDLEKEDFSKDRFCLGWRYQGKLVGHSSINKIKVGEEALIHLHLWESPLRKNGLGSEFFKQSVNFYFRRVAFKRLLCEPYADNPAPNRALSKLGFRFIKKYKTTPGNINFEQEVNQYELTQPIG